MPALAASGVIHNGKNSENFGEIDSSRGYRDVRSFRRKFGLLIPATDTSMAHELRSIICENSVSRCVGDAGREASPYPDWRYKEKYSYMEAISKPCPENDYLGEHAELILSSLFRLTGRDLVDPALSDKDRYRLLFEASFAVVSHNTEADPVFNYGNKVALELFEMKWVEFINLPSRFSAEQQSREERQQLLARVTEHGFIQDYKGVRVSSSGKRFFVEDSIVWNMVDVNGTYRGQAAVLYRWSKLW